MKYVAWFVGVIGTLVMGVYIVAFTAFGNGVVQPIIEKKIQDSTMLESKLLTFSLSMSDFEILLELNNKNTILLKGNYSLLSQSFNIVYRVNLEELHTLKTLTQTQLNNSFHTDGTIKGDMAFVEIDGKSDVAASETNYHIELTEFNPTSIIAKVDKADLKSLLNMVNQKAYASADINLDINFKNIKAHELDGNIILVTKNGKLNSKVMKKDFNITIPTTAFSMNLDAILKGDDVDYSYILSSNLAKITSSGKILPTPLKVDIKYGVNIKELAVLKPITQADIRGLFRLSGNVEGSKKIMNITGKSDFASSNTIFEAVLKDFEPSSLQASIKNMKLQKVLYMVKQPHYADALFDLDLALSSLKADNLKGTINTKIKNGLVDSKYITKMQEFKSMMPKTTFNARTYTVLNKNLVDTKIDFNSNLGDLDIKQAIFDMKDASLLTDYSLKAHNLDKFYFVTQRHLKGSITANGEVKKGKDLDFIMHSNIAGGKLDVKLHNDDFHADLDNLNTLQVLDMIIYPEIFDSSVSGVVDYNLANAKGKFTGTLKDGKFTKNQVLDLAKQYGHTDLYKEKFKGDVVATIKKEKIVASLDLNSNRSSIKTKDTKLNTKTKKINSKLDINANGNPLIITLTGDVNNPKVGIDAQKLIEKEATKVITKEINKFLKGLF